MQRGHKKEVTEGAEERAEGEPQGELRWKTGAGTLGTHGDWAQDGTVVTAQKAREGCWPRAPRGWRGGRAEPLLCRGRKMQPVTARRRRTGKRTDFGRCARGPRLLPGSAAALSGRRPREGRALLALHLTVDADQSGTSCAFSQVFFTPEPPRSPDLPLDCNRDSGETRSLLLKCFLFGWFFVSCPPAPPGLDPVESAGSFELTNN